MSAWRVALLAKIVAWTVLPLVAAQLIASPIMAFGLFKLKALTAVPPSMFAYAWSYYLWSYWQNATVQWWGAVSAGVAATVVVLILICGVMAWQRAMKYKLRPQGRAMSRVPAPRRARSSVHGAQRWMEVSEAKRLYGKPDPETGFIPIVELNRVDEDRSLHNVPFDSRDSSTWGQGGKAKLVADPMLKGEPASGVLIGGTGAGKTASFTIPALHSYRGSMVINDPSGQASGITARWRREEMGHRVIIIDPENPRLCAFNALKTIDITSPLAAAEIKAFVTEVAGASKKDASGNAAFFKPKAIALGTAVLADMLYDPTLPADLKTVKEWRRRIVTPEKEMKKFLQGIYANTKSDYARDIVGELMDTYVETASGIRSHATEDTEWLSYGPYADMLSGNTFNPADLCGGRMTIYVQFPSDKMASNPGPVRVVLGSLMRAVMAAKGRVATVVPFLVDETYQLKHMTTLSTVRDEGRKYGMAIYTMWQSEGQIDEVWGATNGSGKKAWFNSAAWVMYLGGVNDIGTAKELSELCGSYTAIQANEGESYAAPSGIGLGRATRTANNGMSLQKVMLVAPSELRSSFRRDEALILWKNQFPARFGAAAWYRRPEMVRDLQPDSFQQGLAA